MSGALLLGAVVLGQQLAERRATSGAASPNASAATAAVSPILTPLVSPAASSAAPPDLPGAYESPVLGYSIRVPAGYRPSECLGRDTFTLLSGAQERAETLGHVARGGPVAMWTFQVTAWFATGMTAVELAERRGCPGCQRIPSPAPSATDPLTQRPLPQERAEPIALNGREAARLLVDDEPRLYVVRSGDRHYVIELYYDPNVVANYGLPRPSVLTPGILEYVARTFQPRSTGPIPTATPQPDQPPAGARQAAVQLASGLQARDPAALRSIAPPCWLRTSQANAGPVGRPMDAYLADLQQRFATGLRIRVDPEVQVAAAASRMDGRRLFVRSEWTEDGVTSKVDLFLDEENGRWFWAGVQIPPP